ATTASRSEPADRQGQEQQGGAAMDRQRRQRDRFPGRALRRPGLLELCPGRATRRGCTGVCRQVDPAGHTLSLPPAPLQRRRGLGLLERRHGPRAAPLTGGRSPDKATDEEWSRTAVRLVIGPLCAAAYGHARTREIVRGCANSKPGATGLTCGQFEMSST